MAYSLKQRATDTQELMDAPNCDAVQLSNTYRQFDRINTAVSGWRGIYTGTLRPLLKEAGPGATVLDIGCGGGDVLRRLARWAQADGLTPCFVGADPDRRAVRYARSVSTPSNLCFVSATSGELADAGERFDVVLSNHVLHHLADHEVQAICLDSERLATRLVLHSDIHRHPIAYAGFPLIGGWFRDSFILKDGLLSIRRAFTPEELRALAPEGWRVKTTFPFRLHLEWQA